MKRVIFLLTVFSICCTINYAQVFEAETTVPVKKLTKDWSFAIDTTWGEGLTTTQKLDFFDTWWYRIDQTWGGFPNLTINWDSLKNYYRPIIEAGVSRGRFQGILTRLTRALNEAHAYVVNPNIDSIFGISYDQYGLPIEFPNFQSYNYKPGIPLLNLAYLFRTNFGAGVTAYQDSIALVYSVMPNHPLGLELGDIILGYDGVPWKECINDLLNQELPILFGKTWASTMESLDYISISSAGTNWGLFDTIDILKYNTGNIVHLPTSLLESIQHPYFIATDQLPINGVPFPNLNNNQVVSWGVVEGTSIGYINVWDWYTGSVSALFEQAVNELMHLHNVTGLILDFRVNQGGYYERGNGGFKHLFNEDHSSNLANAVRIPGNDHFLFNITSTLPFIMPIVPTTELFDHPIAVLTGPMCLSAGDFNSYRMRFHPMARFFGKNTMGAFISYDDWQNIYLFKYNYLCRMDNGSAYSNYNNEGFLIHKGVPVDEEVWLTRDGVANGQDDVVNRAIEWINNMVYPHDILSEKTFYSKGQDTVVISSIFKNPNSHQLTARGYFHNLSGNLIDSLELTQQVLESNGEYWKGNKIAPSSEEILKVSVTVFDETALDQFTVPNATRFTTAGPVNLDSISIRKQFTLYNAKPYIHNDGHTATINNVTVKLTSNDPWITNLNSGPFNYPALLPGVTTGSASNYSFRVIDSLFPGHYNFKVEVLSDNWHYWTDSMQVIVTGVEDESQVPLTFNLDQNYPNPFNPSTTISWQSPVGSHQVLKVFDVLGNEIATLVDEYKPAGKYEFEFGLHSGEGRNLPAGRQGLSSGVYFYQLKAGNFLQTRKMILLR
jgi:hypothetical protein